MIDKSVIKRLVIQYKALNTDYAVTFTHEQLEAFATAIIENYKASLRPITVKSSYAGVELQLYALPKETK